MPEDCDCPRDWENTRGHHSCHVHVLQFVIPVCWQPRALEANEFGPACLAFTQCFSLGTQLPSRSSIRIHSISRNTWPREMQSAVFKTRLPGFDQHSPVISMYLCVNDGTYFSVKNKSVMEICRAWKKHQKDKRS